MAINLKELSLLLGEYNSLTNQTRMTKQDEQRCAYLQTAIAAVKSGASLREVDEHFFNERSRAAGLPEVRLSTPLNAIEKEARGYQALTGYSNPDYPSGNLSPGRRMNASSRCGCLRRRFNSALTLARNSDKLNGV
jgi:hypothetical protein